MNRDFTLEMYGQICGAVVNLGYSAKTFTEFLAEESSEKVALFRHDVDRMPKNALKIAQIENHMGIRSTYYFRAIPGVFIPRILYQVAALGHEIGYHYETLSQAKGNQRAAIQDFRENLEKMRRIAPVKTISMHGSPFSPHDNRDIWKIHDFRDFGIVGEAYLSIDYSKIAYFTDTGRIWNNTRFNIRDRVTGPPLPEFRSTEDMLRYLEKARPENVCVLTHPNRWADNFPGWTFNLLSDWVINGAKWGVSRMRRRC